MASVLASIRDGQTGGEVEVSVLSCGKSVVRLLAVLSEVKLDVIIRDWESSGWMIWPHSISL